MHVHQAASVQCVACGGSIALSGSAPHSACPYCGAAMQLRDEVKQGVQRYESEAHRLLGREALARRKAAMHARAARHNGPMVGLVVLFAIVLTWWLLAGVSGIAAKIPVGVNVGLVAFSLVSILAMGWVWASMMKAPADAELGAVGLAMCDNCGAFIPFKQGEAVTACAYCRGHALKPATLATELLAGGRAALRDGEEQFATAEADNWRTAAEARVGGARMGVGGWVVVSVLAACGMTGALIFGMLSPSGATHATWWIWVAIGGAVVAAIALVVRATKQLMADNAVFERRFGVRIVASEDPYRQGSSAAAPPPVIVNPIAARRN